jgi:hypothetical protein
VSAGGPEEAEVNVYSDILNQAVLDGEAAHEAA